jgi:hypothetical protein
MMGHALPYFAPHIEALGCAPVQDLIAYEYMNPELPLRARRILQWAQARELVRLRTIRMGRRDIGSEIALILDILNDGWSGNWGFVPMTGAEAAEIATILKLFLKPENVIFAEHEGQTAAFGILFPNINEVIRDLRGRLAPFGWLKLLWRLKVRSPKSARLALMGVRKAHQTSALGAALALSIIEAIRTNGMAQGVRRSELSWVLESNPRMRRIIEMVGARPYKRYRIYQKVLT